MHIFLRRQKKSLNIKEKMINQTLSKCNICDVQKTALRKSMANHKPKENI